MLSVLSVIGSLLWLIIWLLPWKPWQIRERLEADEEPVLDDASADELTVVIPARNEANSIIATLSALARQTEKLRVIVVDDQSSDGSSAVVAAMAPENLDLRIVHGRPLPDGWSGKLWALEQALSRVETPWLLQLDADIQLAPGMLGAMLQHATDNGHDLVSVLPAPPMKRRWEKLLLPAWVFFFRLLYPFALSNRPGHFVAAAAGGCLLVRLEALQAIGAYSSFKDAQIDDCTLARLVKGRNYRTWIGLSHGVTSHRSLGSLKDIIQAGTRTGFPRLHYSLINLIVASAVLLILTWGPPVGMLISSSETRIPGLAGSFALFAVTLPLLRFFGRSGLWPLALPLAGSIYCWTLWRSALHYRLGDGIHWKSRSYTKPSKPKAAK